MPERPPQNTELAEKEAELKQVTTLYNENLREFKELTDKLDRAKQSYNEQTTSQEAKNALIQELEEKLPKLRKLLDRQTELHAELEALGSSIVGG